MANTKMWGKREFWGVGFEFDQVWYLSEEQKELQTNLIDLCRTTLRPNGIRFDKTYEFPRENLEALAGMGLLGLTVPLELGGMAENDQCAAMVCETIARYGCPSTALVYTMHLLAVSMILLRYQNNDLLKDILRRLDNDVLVGTTPASDPATGGHFWYQMSSKSMKLPDDTYKVLKFGSWTTSAGFADWYATPVVSPNFDGDYSNVTIFVFFKDEVRASIDEWTSLGLHGNQSGPIVLEATLEADRIVGTVGDGSKFMSEIGAAFQLFLSSVLNGIAMGSIDLAKRHVCSKTHGDVGMRVCDYSAIQDSFGESIISTNASRALMHSAAMAFDLSIDGDGNRHRSRYEVNGWQAKYCSAKNVATVVDKMLFACGGTGYKTELGVERLLRDGKAGWVFAPSNEVLQSNVGKVALIGPEAIDPWCQKADERVLQAELRKLGDVRKKKLAERLLNELNHQEGNERKESDFNNPLATEPPSTIGVYDKGGVSHAPAFIPDTYTGVKVAKIDYLTKDKKYATFMFDLPDPGMHTGCMNGQYIEIKLPESKSPRYLSPISTVDSFGKLEVVLRFESHGALATYLRTLSIGDRVDFRGPCGGFEYTANRYSHLVFICSGIGVSPALQVIRAVLADNDDNTHVTLIYQARNRDELLFSDELDKYKMDKLRVSYTLQDPDDSWEGSEGFIDYKFLQSHLPQPRNDGSMKVLLCGGGQMVTVCLNALCLLEFGSQDIFIYGPFAGEQVKSMFGRKTKLFVK